MAPFLIVFSFRPFCSISRSFVFFLFCHFVSFYGAQFACKTLFSLIPNGIRLTLITFNVQLCMSICHCAPLQSFKNEALLLFVFFSFLSDFLCFACTHTRTHTQLFIYYSLEILRLQSMYIFLNSFTKNISYIQSTAQAQAKQPRSLNSVWIMMRCMREMCCCCFCT